MKRTRLSALIGIAAAFVALLIANPRASQRISIVQTGPATTVVRIDEPIVNQRLTEYRDIRFQPGDQITMTTATRPTMMGPRISARGRAAAPRGSRSQS